MAEFSLPACLHLFKEPTQESTLYKLGKQP